MIFEIFSIHDFHNPSGRFSNFVDQKYKFRINAFFSLFSPQNCQFVEIFLLLWEELRMNAISF